MATFKFAPNIAVAAEVQYLDIVPGEHGSQVRLKGKIDGEKATAYLPGKLPEQLAVLIHAGVIANAKYPDEVSEAVEIKPLRKSFSMMKAQPAGEKYGKFTIVGSNGNGGTSAAQASSASTPGSAGATAGAQAPPKVYTDLYLKAMDFVFDKALPKFKEKKLDLPPSLIVEIIATVFDAKVREG